MCVHFKQHIFFLSLTSFTIPSICWYYKVNQCSVSFIFVHKFSIKCVIDTLLSAPGETMSHHLSPGTPLGHPLKEPHLAAGEDAGLAGKCLSMSAGGSEPHTAVGLSSPTNSNPCTLNCSPAKLLKLIYH